MSIHPEPNNDRKPPVRNEARIVKLSDEKKGFIDAKHLSQFYHRAMKNFADLVRREISNQIDGRGINFDISTLFYKGAIMELSKAAVYSLGEKKARSILRQISEELRS